MRSLILLLSFALIAGCGSEPEPEPEPPAVADLEAAMAGYDAWTQIEPWTGVQESGEAHGAFVQIWWNDTATTAIEAGGSEPMPAGSLIVKEGYGSDDPTDLSAVTVMWKVEDYGWFWARFNAAGEATMSGQPDGCVSCHASGDDAMLAVTR